MVYFGHHNHHVAKQTVKTCYMCQPCDDFIIIRDLSRKDLPVNEQHPQQQNCFDLVGNNKMTKVYTKVIIIIAARVLKA